MNELYFLKLLSFVLIFINQFYKLANLKTKIIW